MTAPPAEEKYIFEKLENLTRINGSGEVSKLVFLTRIELLTSKFEKFVWLISNFLQLTQVIALDSSLGIWELHLFIKLEPYISSGAWATDIVLPAPFD